MSLRAFLLRVKAKLPANGDWIVPTLQADRSESAVDVAASYIDPQKVLNEFSGNSDQKIDEILLSEADRFTTRAVSRADHVRDKAKTLLGTASFFGAIMLGVISFFAQRIEGLPQVVV